MRTLYADENVWMPVVEGLRRRDRDVTCALDENMLGATDREHLELARENGWAILTFDDDFLSIVDGVDVAHAGVIYVPQDGRSIGELVRRIDGVLEGTTDGELHDTVVYG